MGHFETQVSSASNRFRARIAPKADVISTLSSRCMSSKVNPRNPDFAALHPDYTLAIATTSRGNSSSTDMRRWVTP